MNRTDSEIVARVEQAITTIRNGRMVILVDDEDRENEGDLVMAAELVTPEAINFMAKHGRGLICLSLTPERCDQLALPMMVQRQPQPASARRSPSASRPRRRHHRHQRRRSRAHHPRRRRPTPAPTTSSARATSSRCAPGRRRAGAHRPDRGLGRPRSPRRPRAGRRHLRDHERRRHDGPSPELERSSPRSTTCSSLHRRPDPLPPPPRTTRRTHRRGRGGDRRDRSLSRS
jgi:hypothetical protein